MTNTEYNITQSMPIGDIKGELLVTYNRTVTKNPPEKEECHGIHEIDQDEITFDILSVELVFGSEKGIPIELNKKIKWIIEYGLE
jgi:hypothetical protein